MVVRHSVSLCGSRWGRGGRCGGASLCVSLWFRLGTGWPGGCVSLCVCVWFRVRTVGTGGQVYVRHSVSVCGSG